MPLTIDLTGKRALVTGVSCGIGAGVAAALTEAGCDVAGCGLHCPTDAGPCDFVRRGQHNGRAAAYWRCDVTAPADVAEFVRESAEVMGGLDIVVSNAGRNIFEGVDGCSEEQWREAMELNLAATWRLVKACRPRLAASSRPVIIIISSNHAFRTLPGCFPYNVAKAGLNALVQSLAIEWGPHIRTVGLAPGFIETPGNQKWFESFADPAAKRRQVEAMHPAGRFGTAREIGALCAFLASDHAGFISGTTLIVDGGRSALLQDV